jgi:hypothetical protein
VSSRLFWRTLSASEPALEAAVVSTPGLAAAERLDIYGRMYFWRLHDALAEDFEKTAAALGSERFADVVRGYLAEHPSGHPSVRHLGRDFAGFLAARPPDGAPAWLADLGRLEWARVEVFDAADADPIRAGDLRAIDAADWTALRLRPTPALEVVESAWPLHEIWRDGGDPSPARPRSASGATPGPVYHCAMDPSNGSPGRGYGQVPASATSARRSPISTPTRRPPRRARSSPAGSTTV